MKSKAIFMALLALAFQAQAASVSQSQAVSAASRWAQSGRVLGTRLGSEVDLSGVKTYSVSPEASFHAVPFKNGGMVFVSADTESEPIIAFTATTNVDLRAGSPLFGLLQSDALFRAKLAELRAGVANNAQTSALPAARSTYANKWTALSVPNMSSDKSAPPIAEGDAMSMISDIRVAPMLTTRWSQTNAGLNPCYNYYTPNGAPCGCTATAMSQILRYFSRAAGGYPESFMGESLEYDCEVNGKAKKLSVLCDEESSEPIPYAWDKMIDVPNGLTDEENRAAIGHLTYDVAVALESEFSDQETSASPTILAKTFKEAFGYKNAYVLSDGKYYKSGELHYAGVRQKVIFTNLDAAKPVLLAIYGCEKDRNGKLLPTKTGGHAVVADGYGFTEVNGVRTEYVHVNLGWGGTDDAWYNLPEIDTAMAGATISNASGFDFMFLNAAAFNLSIEDNEVGKEILSGRIIDEDGEAVTNATVAISFADGTPAASANTDSKGIYHAYLAGGTNYLLHASVSGERRFGDVQAALSRTVVGEPVTNIVAAGKYVGNSWGNDITILYPTVQVISGGVTNLYSSLDKALAAAKDGDRVEIIEATALESSFNLRVNCTISAAGADPYAMPVVCNDGAMLVVESGETLFTNVVFKSSSTVVKSVGGTIVVSGIAVFDDMVSGHVGLLIDKNDHFIVRGCLLNGITLECAGASIVDDMFGMFYGDDVAAVESAARIVSPNGSNRAGTAKVLASNVVSKLVWADDVAANAEVAVGYVDGMGVSDNVYYRTLDQLFDAYPVATNVVITKSGAELRKHHDISGDYVISTTGDMVRVVVAADAGMSVKTGFLNVSNLEFSNFRGNGIFIVDGSTASMSVSNVVFRDIEGTNTHSGAISVLNGGALTVGDGTMFEDCRASGRYSATRVVGSNGGAIYIGAGGSLEMVAVESPIRITNCQASQFGGGIYVESESSVNISGDVIVRDNFSGERPNSDNIYLADGTATLLCSGDIVSGSKMIGVGFGSGVNAPGNGEGVSFAKLGAEVVATNVTAKAFVNDVNDSLSASADGQDLKWVSIPDLKVPFESSVCYYIDGDTTNAYARLEDAFVGISGEAVIFLRASTELTTDIEISDKITLASVSPDVYRVDRVANVMVKIFGEGSLTLENIEIDGGLGSCGLFMVSAGSMTMNSGSKIANVNGSDNRASCAITVCNGGKFTMESGAEITQCVNNYVDLGTQSSYGGALLVEDKSEARLLGGKITGCRAYSAGGVFIGSQSKVCLSNDIEIAGNKCGAGPIFTKSNLCVSDDSELILLGGEFTGSIGYNQGVNADAVRFGTANEFTGDIQAAAHRFRHDVTGDYGMAVANGSEKLLVWGSQLNADGKYITETGLEYDLIPGSPVSIVFPDVKIGLVYNGEEQIGIEPDVGYTVSGNSSTDAGTKSALVEIRPGYVWSDGGEASRTVEWVIAKAPYELVGVSFEDYACKYEPNKMQFHPGIAGDLPDWFDEVEYRNNGRVEPGTNEVVAVLSGNGGINYQDFHTNLVAKLIVVGDHGDDPGPVPPGPDPIVVTPSPIAFREITRVSDSQWKLVITNCVQGCWYRLGYTDNLASGFTHGDWEQATADGPWTTNITVTTGGSIFWKAEAKEGVIPVTE